MMLSQPKAKEEAFDCSTPKGTIIPQRETHGHVYPKEDKPQDELQKEATVLGVSPLIVRKTLGKYCKCVLTTDLQWIWEILFFFFLSDSRLIGT